MIIIAHRGNITGANPSRENSPKYIEEALTQGFDVEIDVWYEDTEESRGYYLGHDSPDHPVTMEWLKKDGLWCHAKNQKALERMHYDEIPNYFWHQEDRFTLTSRGDMWCYPNNPSRLGILVNTGKPQNIMDVRGVCTDYAQEWRSASSNR